MTHPATDRARSDDPTPIKRAVHGFAAAIGMEKRRATHWYRRSDEVIEILNLERSQWGPQYHVNLAFWLRALGDDPKPLYNKSHVVARANMWSDRLDDLLDLEQPLGPEERQRALDAELRAVLAPILEEATTLDGLTRLGESGRLASSRVKAKARPLVGNLRPPA